MPSNFTRPTLAELIDRAQTDIEGALQGVNARLRRRVEFVFARAMAGLTHGLHGHLAFIAEQILPDQAAEAFLLRWGSLFGVDRIEGDIAAGPATVTGLDPRGGVRVPEHLEPDVPLGESSPLPDMVQCLPHVPDHLLFVAPG